MQNRQSFGFLRFAFGYIWKKKNFHHLRLYLEMNTDHAATHTARFAEFSFWLTQVNLLKFRRKMKTICAHIPDVFPNSTQVRGIRH